MFKSRKFPVQNAIDSSSQIFFDTKRRSVSVGRYFEEIATEFSNEEKREWEDFLRANFPPFRKGEEYTDDQRNKIMAAERRLVQILTRADFKLSATIPEAIDKVRKDVEEFKNKISEDIANASRKCDDLKNAENNLENAEEEMKKQKASISEMRKKLEGGQ